MKSFEFNHISGAWFGFTFRKRYVGSAKIFNKGSIYGICGGKISKLNVHQNEYGRFNYDRGLDYDFLPTGILSTLLEYLTESHSKWMEEQKKRGAP